MIPAPFGFFEVDEERVLTDAAQFGEAQFGKTPEALDPIDVVSAPRELIAVMVNAMVFVPA